MRTTRWTTVAAAAALAALMMSGCSGTAAPTPEALETAPMFASDEEAFAAAEATYRAYVEALNQAVLEDPATFDSLYAFTAGPLNAADRKNLSQLHADGVIKSGRAALKLVEMKSRDSGYNELSLAVCLEVSDVRLVDATGASVVQQDRVDIQTMTVVLEQQAGTPTGFIIADIRGREGAPECEL